MKRFFISSSVTAAVITLLACGGSGSSSTAGLSGTVKVDGSSTVFPITEAVAEEFGKVEPRVRVTVGISGTGGGFKKYVIGETDINDASRPIKGKEIKKASDHDIEFIELPIAFDGLSVVVNRDNDWVDYLTVDELNLIWKPGSHVQKWSDIRPEWPDEPLHLFGPGTDSGTFDYFTEAINGKSQACRGDFSKSEDDNVLVQGIAGDKYALGFFGFAYYQENTDKLKVVPIDGGNGPVAPSVQTINNGSYQPLSRPIFIYVNPASAQRKEVAAFVNFYLDHAPQLVNEVGYVALPEAAYEHDRTRFAARKTGSLFSGKETIGLKIEDILKAG
ncbi:MAG: PstS family phosphate ABC transporter substrate-binding protein [Candidatus Neomarinimicrobiota bacterium]|nr:MAG: PstS family phosphate ABC transporter substrate-binding protein [Candidatus Neomarinimicrobiota bacterium]